ncbi:hypothetical protein AKJ09_02345 [Labilithrix luteola]|uniref:Uncharacterized protein n=1 Tax=Labilithrix luteola TaxID=1391654 RepID=A0A0K1PQM1_9BACT|nr:hypothetical protein AKJ09_02345 [Labilithrix luteola]
MRADGSSALSDYGGSRRGRCDGQRRVRAKDAQRMLGPQARSAMSLSGETGVSSQALTSA